MKCKATTETIKLCGILEGKHFDFHMKTSNDSSLAACNKIFLSSCCSECEMYQTQKGKQRTKPSLTGKFDGETFLFWSRRLLKSTQNHPYFRGKVEVFGVRQDGKLHITLCAHSLCNDVFKFARPNIISELVEAYGRKIRSDSTLHFRIFIRTCLEMCWAHTNAAKSTNEKWDELCLLNIMRKLVGLWQ